MKSTTFLIITIFWYLIGCFYSVTLDITDWSKGTRAIMISLYCFTLLGALIANEDNNEGGEL